MFDAISSRIDLPLLTVSLPTAITGLPGGTLVSISIVVGSLLACVGLFALSRTTWGKSRPTHRYAAASLAVHLILLAIASTVRYGGAQSGGAEAPPVRVRIVMRAPEVENATPDAADPEVDPVTGPEENSAANSEAEQTKPEIDETQKPPLAESTLSEPQKPPLPLNTEVALKQENTLAEPLPYSPQPPSPIEKKPSDVPANEPEPVVANSPEGVSNPSEASSHAEATLPDSMPNVPIPAASLPTASIPTLASELDLLPEIEPEPKVPSVEDKVTITEAPEAGFPRDLSSASPSAWKSTYNTRGEQQRLRLALEEGGSQETENAVAHAVDWFARSQRPDGAWDAARWGAGREQKVLNHNRAHAGIRAETGLTGLALLAMQGAGHNHMEGAYQNAIRNGLAYLLESQKQNGSLAGEATTYAATYCHSMATFALAEAFATTGDERLRPGVVAAIDYLVRSQSKATGGWRYRPGDRGDMSQMGWVLMALRSAEIAEIRVPTEVWNGIERFLKSVERGNQGGLAAYQAVAPTSPTMTAEALYCRQILGLSKVRPLATSEAVTYLAQRLPSQSATSNRPVNFYYWYYATLALHHQRHTDSQTREAWQRWNDSMIHSLLPLQVASGQNQGSWTPTTLWGGYGGRVYSTAMATMCLEVYYRYDEDSLGRDPWLAARVRPSAPLLRR